MPGEDTAHHSTVSTDSCKLCRFHPPGRTTPRAELCDGVLRSALLLRPTRCTVERVAALFVALGGAFGSLLRFGANLWCAQRLAQTWPFATTFVNVLGCFALAFLSRAVPERIWLGVPLMWTLGTGVLGGFTTYSSFNLELLQMMQRGEPLRALAYAGATLFGCLASGALGLWCAERWVLQ